ncbi:MULTISPECIES: hypothetical protein [Kingella]|jgi:hypothetical protein|uniref:Uncharacterized protein n=1 Tax=Kingella bonacorsii TaxID=2796361 RepID=A0ABS1BV43_9NEIS|nr:hypothetical protein [Kingella bonacorsii]MBK0396745.1 hypothetical protein [Kingella bonacorsii]
MTPHPYPAAIAARINESAATPLLPNAQFYHTANGYWIAWQPETAAVLPPDLPAGEPCDWVEGAESLAELASLIESGDYEALLAEDADNANEHAQEGGCACGCAHG